MTPPSTVGVPMSLKDAAPEELSIFIVTPSSDLSGPAADLSDINGVSSRKRKKHTKSHAGCVTCKRRRVKCDNVSPSCRSCTRRGETCSLSNPSGALDTPIAPPIASSSKRDAPVPQLPPGLRAAGLDALQLRLLDHFFTDTAYTLPFGGDVWRGGRGTLSLEHDYLLHSVLLVSAQHLSYLSPNNPEYRRASLFHLSKALPQYRQEVSKPLSMENADFAMAASFLLIYYAWSDVDVFDINDDACFINDQLFTMTGGLRETFISAIPLVSSGRSVFSETIAHHPKDAVEELARTCSLLPARFEQLFCEEYCAHGNDGIMDILEESARNIPEFSDILAENQNIDNNDFWYSVTRPHDPGLVGFLDAAVRLAPLCSIASELDASFLDGQLREPLALKDGTSNKSDLISSPAITNLARYIYSWPNVCSPGVLRLLAKKDESIILLLSRFYKTIKVILPEEFWWAHRRANKIIPMFEKLLAESHQTPRRSSLAAAIPQDVVVRATNFALQANKTWRHYCVLYGLEGKKQKT